ncbi:MAG TPA: tripartite tricarboxylate transporter substrate binding protein [Burkholderiales bacterium]|nr:tripartite tricarboxylate transporter substrate binding protein [Burkholderiales bacterium]
MRAIITAPVRLKSQLIAAAFLAALSATATGQAYPTKPVRVIVPFPAGGGSDFTARTVNARLSSLLGQNLIIDTRAGAGGNLGAEIAAKSPPDGYTLLMANNSLTVSASLYRKLPFDPFKDFVPITMACTSPNVVVVHPSLPARSVKELVALARAKPGEIMFASSGAGSPSHLAGELFRTRTGSNIVHVAYKGAAPAVMDQIGGHVMLSFIATIVSKPHIDSGKLRALAVTTEKRWAGLPDVPAVAEAGYPGFNAYGWWAYVAPAGTPRAIVDRLAADIGKVLAMAETKERFASQGTDAVSSTPEALAAFMKSDFELWDKIIKQQGIRLD